MIVTSIIHEGDRPTDAQLKEVEEAARNPITFDEDCPELSESMLKSMAVAVMQRNRYKTQKKA